MANDTTSNPWILDEEKVATTERIRILKMVYYAGTAGDDLAVAHANGSSIWKVRAAAAATNYEDYAGVVFEFPEPFIADGLDLVTLDGGELWVWLK